jgi:hypothetical protein
MRALKVITVNCLVFLSFLFLAELGLRIFWRMGTLGKEIYRTSKDPILRYELKPDLKAMYEGVYVITNSDGFRGRSYPIPKPAHVYRILLLGDSVAFGRHLSNEDMLSSRLEGLLKRECPATEFEVLNMGVEGYNTIQELEMLKAKGLKYKPDLLMVYYCFNDPGTPEYYFKKSFINRHSAIARYVLWQVKKRMAKEDRRKKGIKSIPDDFRYLYKECSDCWPQTKAALFEMADIARQQDIPMVLLIAPEMSEDVSDFGKGYPFWYVNQLLEGLRYPNMIIIDPIREFSARNLSKKEVNIESYPNRKAYDIITEYILTKFKENAIPFCR